MKLKKIINFVPTGTQPTRDNSLAPLQVNEIIEEVILAYELGITLVHIHARDNDDNNTTDKLIYEKIISGIKKYCKDLTICVSLSGRNFPNFEERSSVLELMPDMASLSMSSMNFPTSASVNSPETILKLIEKMDLYGVIPEIECFDSGMINYTNYLINKNILKEPFYINVIFGNLFNSQIDPSSLSSITANLMKNTTVCFGGIGKYQLNANILGLMYANGVRVGLEDNLYYNDKIKASNAQLLKRIINIMSAMNCVPMKPLDFKKMGYENRKLNNFR